MDKKLNCIDCGKEFTITDGEQAFFAQKGFSEPKRCKECRAIKKQQLGNYNNNRGGY
jgi:NAD-dependent SIR2 family protein deacetylase